MHSGAGALPPLVSVAWLADERRAADLIVIDASVATIRSPGGPTERYPARGAFENEGHIPGARFADLVSDFSEPAAPFPFTRPGASRLEAAAGALGVSNHSRIVVYDRFNGIWAARLWWLFKAFGHDAVAVLDGGLAAWAAAGQPLARGAASPRSAEFRASARDGYFVDQADVIAAMESRSQDRLVCALRGAVFRGEEAPYGRAGHIPGSLSIPFADLVEPGANILRSRETLCSRFAPVLADDRRIILYCGGGIAAAGSALALALLGVDRVAIYDGSLSEWAADPSLPMRVGPD
jgi:thiosulfate/3-mercaptopyruvate sulfurtransferase